MKLKDLPVMRDFLWDSPIYQEIFGDVLERGEEKGREEGREEGIEMGKMQALAQIRARFLEFVNERFPALERPARLCATDINNVDELVRLLMEIAMAQTEEEARAELRANLGV
jgi:predicted transposase YdaD